MEPLSIEKKARRLSIYIGESDRWKNQPLYAAVLERLKQEGLAGATVTRGVAGFGAHSRIHTAAIERLSIDLPLKIEVIDTPAKIERALEIVSAMVQEGLVTVEDVEVVLYTHRYLKPLPSGRFIREIMTRSPVVVQADQGLLEAWTKMLDQSIKALPVVDPQGLVVGIVTNEDLLDRAGLRARLAVARRLDDDTLEEERQILRGSHLTVRDVMSHPVVTVKEDDPIGLAAGRMVEHNYKRLPVVGAGGKLVGVVSRLDLLRQVLDMPSAPAVEPIVSGSGRTVGEVMSAKIPSVRLDSRLAEIITAFLAAGEHRLIVFDQGGRAVGLISDSDVVGRIQPPLRRGVLGALRGQVGPPDSSITAAELMSPGVELVDLNLPVVEAVQKMLASGRKVLIVTGEENHPLGFVDREMLLRALIH